MGKITYNNLADGTITIETPTVEPLELKYKSHGSEMPYGTKYNGQYTTGNAILTGENPTTGVMREIKFDP